MKQRDILALMDGIAPGIAASFAKAIAPVIARLEAAEKRVAELEKAPADIDLDALIAAAVERITAKPKEVAALELKIDSGDLTKAVEEAIARIQPDEAAIKSTVAAEVGRQMSALVAAQPKAPTAEAVAALVPAGKDADPEAIRSAVAAAVAALPPVPTAAEIAALVPAPTAPTAEEVAALVPAPRNGADADPEVIKAMVAEAVAALPPAEPGKDATPEQIAAAVEKVLATWERPKDGESVTVEQLRPLVDETVGKRVAEIPVPRDGVGLAGGMINRDGELTLTLSDGKVVELGVVVGKDGEAGLGFDNMDITHDGERGFTFRLMQGDRVKEFPFSLPVVLDRGVFKDGTEYVAGDGTTWGGSFWIAQTTTKDKPGTSDAWRLAVKKGRDGQDLRPGELKPPKPVKL